MCPQSPNRSPLHLAVKFGQLNTVALLVERGADLEVKDVAHDSSPLGWAAFFGNAEISRHLVEMGADVNHECNPLYYALRGREGEWSEFSSATSDEYEAVVQILKAHGAQEEPPKT